MNSKNKKTAIQQAINNHYAVISFKPDGTIISANQNFLDIFGYKLEDIKRKHHKIFCDEKYVNSDEYDKFWSDLILGKVQSEEFTRIKKNGKSVFIQASYKPLKDENEEIFEILKFAQDITEKKLTTLYNQAQIKAINKSQAIIEFDMNGFILDANENFLEAMGYSLDEIINKHHGIFCDKTYLNSMEYKKFWEKLSKGIFDTGKYLRIGKNNKKVWIQATYTPILDFDKNPIKIVKFAQDITKYETIKTDQLTKLFNREKLIVDIQENEENNLSIIDLDSFSSINDFYGYFVGDKIIIRFSEILTELLNDEFTVYRIYADKFAILNTTLSRKKFYNLMIEIIEKIKSTSIDLDIKSFYLLVTCGISFEDQNKILNTAEIVNKFAKKISKNILVYSEALNIEKEYEKNIYWTEKIKDAIKEDRIIVYYQPIYNNKTRKIEKFEALVRLEEKNGEIISPFKFLDIAKKSKQYIDITKIVIDKSFNTFKDNDYEFSINLTVEDILDDNLNKYIISKIKEFDIANRLVLELVESEKITRYEPVYEFINKLKKMGCKIAIDDFGSGYSNFEYLIKIDADFVKIDGSIIRGILEDEHSLEIVKSIITFANKMKIKTIAEFISDEKLLNKVVQLDLDYSQGFYIGKPEKEIVKIPLFK